MRVKVIALFVVCLACLFSANAQVIKEENSYIVVNEKNIDAFLEIENSDKGFRSPITLELVDEKDNVRAKTSQTFKIKNGTRTYKLSLPIANLLEKESVQNRFIWYRLRYKVGENTGFISLSEVVKDNFQLRVNATEILLAGMNYRSHIRAVNPLNNQPIADVLINAELTLERLGDDEKDVTFNLQKRTDKNGFVTLDFQIPTEGNFNGEGEIRVVGKKRGIVREATEYVQITDTNYNFLILTDKPIYQPEQDLKVRGTLLKGSEKKKVVPNKEVEFRIQDEENTLLFRETVKTSEFGVASIAWRIPENAKLGNYKIRVKDVEADDGEYVAYKEVRVSRYDLPNFVVNPKPNKDYYLPDIKEAEVEVRADYLFGKPVKKGKIRVVREKSRKWNWKKQKYDIDEGQVRESETDSEGKFTAKIDLSQAHKDLKGNDYAKFKDLNFTAYFTDLTTNKTEQRRFDIRITKEPIHVYFVGERYSHHPKLPVNAYVSTFYADGTPVSCDVELKIREDDSDNEFKTIQRLKTNSYGGGKLSFMRPNFEDDDDAEIRIIAKDKKGNEGTFGNDTYYNEIHFDDEDEAKIQIQTQKSIYKPGEAVKIDINSSLQKGLVYVDVIRGWSVIDSYFVNLKKGKAKLKIPYQNNFQGELKIAAYFEDEDGHLVNASRGIIFPTQKNLKLNAKFDKETYKPAEQAKVKFSVLDTIGKSVESTLGVVVFDKAVEERARTDSEFNGMFGSFYGWLGYGESFGGVNVKDLNDLDLSKPISKELQLVAEIMFYDNYYSPNFFHSRNYKKDAKSVYHQYFRKQFTPIEKALEETYKNKNFRHPTDEKSLVKILSENAIDFNSLRDPWGQKYRLVFEVVKTQNVVKIQTAGADKKFDTDDDFTVSSMSFKYFNPTGKKIDKAVENYHKRTGKFIRDEKTLFQEMGISELLDRFGNPYKIEFGINGKLYTIKIHSLGKDGIYSPYSWKDDFDVWINRINYFQETEAKLNKILQNTKEIPQNEADFIRILSKNGLEFEQIKDGFGQKVYLTERKYKRYTDRVEIENVRKFGEKRAVQHKKVTPVIQEVIEFTVRSKGRNGIKTQFYGDDFTLVQYLFVLSEQTKDDEKPKSKSKSIVFQRGSGGISGKITDANDAVIPGVTVIATNESTGLSRIATSNASGEYVISNLPSGKYQVKFEMSGFKSSVVTNVFVSVGRIVTINVPLEPGGIDAVVNVVSDSVVVNTTSASVNTTIDGQDITQLPLNGRRFQDLLALKPGVASHGYISGAKGAENTFVIDGKKYVKDEYGKLVPLKATSTPRLRKYFPETLYWNPEVLTNKNGQAELNFKMADNITTWKLYVIASTKNGKIGVSEKEVQSFQPFFADLDPPKFLTQGDEIHLPTQVRNYTKSKQKVDVTMSESDWFSFLNEKQKHIEVASGSTENAVFGFRADKFVKDGKQKVTAIAETNSDAIEKLVTVRPDGHEIVKTQSRLFKQNADFAVNFPSNAIKNTPKAELKLYPNLFAHVAESVEGLLQRPYGCGEQTISSTYPNLMILKFTNKENKMRAVAQKFLQKGYERLLGYQVSSGGFSYWGGNEEANLALTAYAIRFLNDAKAFVAVDENVIKKAEKWLISQQRADGSWTNRYRWENAENPRRTKMITSYVAKTLAALKSKDKNALQKSLAYLKRRNQEIDEPYAMALFGLASIDAGNLEDTKNIAERLSKMAISEGDRVYWKLETNTPFYGWGRAGRIETTALVVQFLIKMGDRRRETGNQTQGSRLKTQNLIARGTQFLLKNKDRYGVWYSTQTTINVLDAFLATLGKDESKGDSVERKADIFINGKLAKSLKLPSTKVMSVPMTLNLSSLLTPNNNQIQVKINDKSSVMTQVVAEHYIKWKDTNISNRNTNKSRQIRLDYQCDKSNVKILEDVTCEVKAERIGFRGYGMLLAEIGIPPGADVSRESLEDAFDGSWSLSRYDILPDRIIVYMWAKAGGTKFKFKFKPRYGINAQTPASFVYDYYNEEAKATVAPMRFVVK